MNQSKPKKKMQCSIPELPTHIILDILSRLPIKTLFNCRLVCKEWLSIVSEPHFVKLHLSRSPVSLLVKPIYRDGRDSRQLRLVDVQVSHHTHPREAQLKFTWDNFPILAQLGIEIVNSCNGVLCLISMFHFYLCNPILGEYITIQTSRYGGKQDASISALGFSPRTNQYKVIRFYRQPLFNPISGLRTYREEAEAQIYTIGEESWRNIGTVPFHLSNHSFNSFVNGAVHWLTFSRDTPDFIRCFDFGTEQSRVVPEPPDFGLHKKEFPNRICVGVLKDCLSISDFSSPLHIDIWIMKHYGIKESWSKEFVIENEIGKRRHLECCEPVLILKSGEILMLINKNALVRYDPRLGRFRYVKIYGIRSEFYATAHIPCFVSLEDVAKGERLPVSRYISFPGGWYARG